MGLVWLTQEHMDFFFFFLTFSSNKRWLQFSRVLFFWKTHFLSRKLLQSCCHGRRHQFIPFFVRFSNLLVLSATQRYTKYNRCLIISPFFLFRQLATSINIDSLHSTISFLHLNSMNNLIYILYNKRGVHQNDYCALAYNLDTCPFSWFLGHFALYSFSFFWSVTTATCSIACVVCYIVLARGLLYHCLSLGVFRFPSLNWKKKH